MGSCGERVLCVTREVSREAGSYKNLLLAHAEYLNGIVATSGIRTTLGMVSARWCISWHKLPTRGVFSFFLLYAHAGKGGRSRIKHVHGHMCMIFSLKYFFCFYWFSFFVNLSLDFFFGSIGIEIDFDWSRSRSYSISVELGLDMLRFYRLLLRLRFSESARKMIQNGGLIVSDWLIFVLIINFLVFDAFWERHFIVVLAGPYQLRGHVTVWINSLDGPFWHSTSLRNHNGPHISFRSVGRSVCRRSDGRSSKIIIFAWTRSRLKLVSIEIALGRARSRYMTIFTWGINRY